MNADSFVFTGQGINSCNMYCYTGNNPISRSEIGGMFWFQFFGSFYGGAISGGFQIVSNFINGNNILDGTLAAFASGASSGLIATTPFGFSTLGTIVSNYGGAIISDVANGKNPFNKDVLINGTIGIIGGKQADEIVSVNKNWIRPEKFSTSLSGNYTKKLNANNAISSGYQLSVETSAGKLMKNEKFRKELEEKMREPSKGLSGLFLPGAVGCAVGGGGGSGFKFTVIGSGLYEVYRNSIK